MITEHDCHLSDQPLETQLLYFADEWRDLLWDNFFSVPKLEFLQDIYKIFNFYFHEDSGKPWKN